MTSDYPKIRRIHLIGLGALSLLSVLVWIAVFAVRPDYKLHVDFFDVGQGDVAFITTPEKTQILIDGGPDSAVLSKLGRAMPFFDRTIDLVVLSHPHLDHLSGLIEVLKRYKVKKVLLSEVTHSSEAYKAFADVLKQKNIPTITAVAGQKILLDDYARLQILYPPASMQGQLFDDLNESSVVARLSFGESDFLFTGDAPKQEEEEVLASGFDVGAEVLKVGHHGSRFSTGGEFLAAVNPKFAVISAGAKNKYGHPYEETLALLKSLGIKALRTDLEGDIEFVSDGRGIAEF